MKRPLFTAVPHEVIDVHLPNLSHGGIKVLLVLLRKTYGWNRETETISLSRIGELAGLSKTTCCDAVAELQGLDLILKTINKADDGSCSSTTYEVNFEEYPPVGRPTTPVNLTDHPGRQADRYKEERKQTEYKEHKNLPKVSLELEEKYTPELLQKHFFWKYKHAKGTKLDSRQGDKPRTAQWLAEQSVPGGEILAALDVFLQGDYWRDQHFPLSAFRKQFQTYLGHARSGSYKSDDLGVSVPSGEVSSVPHPTAPTMPPEVEIWSQIVVECPYQWNPDQDKLAPLIEARMKPYFSSRYEEICRNASAIHRARGAEVGWLTFKWILGKDKTDGTDNAWKLLTTMTWMMAPRSGFGQVNKSMQVGMELLAERKKARAEREAKKNAGE